MTDIRDLQLYSHDLDWMLDTALDLEMEMEVFEVIIFEPGMSAWPMIRLRWISTS